MAVDINDEIRVWGGFTQAEFWTGAATELAVAGVAVLLNVHVSWLVGAMWWVICGGGFAGFWLYQRDLPKGYLLRRFKQEGKFLFIHVPWIKGVDIYAAPANTRRQKFEQAFAEESEHAQY